MRCLPTSSYVQEWCLLGQAQEQTFRLANCSGTSAAGLTGGDVEGVSGLGDPSSGGTTADSLPAAGASTTGSARATAGSSPAAWASTSWLTSPLVSLPPEGRVASGRSRLLGCAPSTPALLSSCFSSAFHYFVIHSGCHSIGSRGQHIRAPLLNTWENPHALGKTTFWVVRIGCQGGAGGVRCNHCLGCFQQEHTALSPCSATHR